MRKPSRSTAQLRIWVRLIPKTSTSGDHPEECLWSAGEGKGGNQTDGDQEPAPTHPQNHFSCTKSQRSRWAINHTRVNEPAWKPSPTRSLNTLSMHVAQINYQKQTRHPRKHQWRAPAQSLEATATVSSGENQFLLACSLETTFLLHAPGLYYFIRRNIPEKSIIWILIKPITYNVFIMFSERTQYLASFSEEYSPWRDFFQLLS